MRQDQLERLEKLRDKLIETSIVDADPANWAGADKKPAELTRDERGDAKWCRSMAVQTVALTMQVQRLLQNPITGGAMVPDQPPAAADPDVDEAAAVEAEIERYESAAAKVIARHTRGSR